MRFGMSNQNISLTVKASEDISQPSRHLNSQWKLQPNMLPFCFPEIEFHYEKKKTNDVTVDQDKLVMVSRQPRQ